MNKPHSRWKQVIAVTSLVAFGAGCVSVHPGRMAVPIEQPEPGMKVSVRLDDKMSDDHFKLLHVTMENTTGDWLRYQRALLDFGSFGDNQKVIIVFGNDIADWYQARAAQIERSRHNRNMFLAGLAITGAIVAGVGTGTRSRATHGIGHTMHAVGALGLATAMTADAVGDDLDRLRDAQVFPESHLMANDLAVPPKMVVKKWVLLQVQPKDWRRLSALQVQFTRPTGEVDAFGIALRCAPRGLEDTPAALKGHQFRNLKRSDCGTL